ncbi:unnamed protein product [Acanthoscelides obtectus]|uniref:Transposase n=1 Tax=Acanthoscelides obtectus TaxID=200917 RepID=A0A9P0KW08_ACAOB|nr:unnamed protein product [Acanthoscelides obtectus]CAK1682456.1 hypothetical protein AOBTE_LOCUS33641 [Acanthoscelides obtectus]
MPCCVTVVFGNEAPHHLSDDPRVGAPKTAVTQENVDAVRKLKNLVSRWIPHLNRVNWCQKTLARYYSGNTKNVYSIVSGDESWIYCSGSENNDSKEKPTKGIRSRSVSKKIVATFASKAGHIATIPLNEQRTIRKINSERRIILHQDNESSHTAQKTRHPDLSTNDFFTFPKIKNRLRGQRFQSPEEAVDAFKNAVLDMPANEWNKCFENWFERMLTCINLRGEYFEKQ